MIIVGHRGAAGTEPENTILSFCRALDFKADELEFDVQMTKDGHVVVIHDATVDRTTNGYGPVTNMSIVDLCRLDAGKGEKVPTLYDLLWFMRCQSAYLNIEIKMPGCEECVAALVKQFADEKKTCVISSQARILRKISRLSLNIGLIFDKQPREKIKIAHRLRVARILPHKRLVTPWLVKRAHRQGMKVIAWTVNEPEEMKQMADAGVDGICTDYPERAAELFKKKTP